MYIIGLHNDEDAGVCLLKDGKILDVINEERLTRKKLHKGFPLRSLDYILKKNNLKLSDINYFAYGWHSKKKNFYEYTKKLINRIIECDLKNKKIKDLILERLNIEFISDGETFDKFLKISKKIGIPEKKIIFLDHHKSHAWSAYACSPFNKSIVFTMDARGDLKSSSVSINDKKLGLREIDHHLSFDSLGFLYGQITYYLGFTPHKHEGKVTGLAAHGNYRKTLKIFKKLINWNGKRIVSNLGYYRPFFTNLNKSLKKDLKKFSKEDIAAGLQYHCEDVVSKYVSFWIKKTKMTKKVNICLAGGLFANVKINQKISQLKNVQNLYVFPHMGDGGLTVGAACQLYFLLTKKNKVELNNVYKGPIYQDSQILKILKENKNKISYFKTKNIKKDIHILLEKKFVIGFFQGRMEFGPRALGARSILFHTKDKNANKWLNDRLKRTEFMPFAPVTLDKLASKCFINWKKNDACSPYMTKTFDCKSDYIKKNPAVVHVDGTARPQVVKRKFNKLYYDVLSFHFEKTKNNSLINTSFNQHEEPIVCTPQDAISSLLSNNIDYLVIGNYVVKKRINE
jgi:carbamoyltransferase